MQRGVKNLNRPTKPNDMSKPKPNKTAKRSHVAHPRLDRGSETPRTDSMCEAIRAMGEVARARNLAYLCRKLERELIEVGNALNEQNERWGGILWIGKRSVRVSSSVRRTQKLAASAPDGA